MEKNNTFAAKSIDKSHLMKKIVLLLLASFAMCSTSWAEDQFAAQRTKWLEKAEASKPELQKRLCRPKEIVIPVESPKAYQGWTYFPDTTKLETFYRSNFMNVREVTFDFGEHLTGYCTIHMKTLGTTPMHGPIRLKLTFCEVPGEMNVPYDPWPSGLSRAWMQDEIITIEHIDCDIPIARRVAMRYLKIELLGGAEFGYAIDDVKFEAVSSAGESKKSLAETCSQKIKDIERVGLATLHECMQTVYEDGPKRDRRLWIGDMYLESLANRYSFQNYDLTKRCLYLFAGLCEENGVLVANLFENPFPHAQNGCYLPSYNLLYIATLLEYYRDTKDRETAEELWPIAKIQIEDVLLSVENFIYNVDKRPAWIFFDWREGLDIAACMQACTICALDDTYELARFIGKEEEVKDFPTIAKKMREAAHKTMYDKKLGMIRSGKQGQVSVQSQAWMIRAGVLNKRESMLAMKNALSEPTVVRCGTPYGTHYLVDAMLKCGLQQEARKYLEDYWGGMVEKGADTFFEAYDPQDDKISPYHFFPVNSYCHAWSCTPIYFIHKYPEIFQK